MQITIHYALDHLLKLKDSIAYKNLIQNFM